MAPVTVYGRPLPSEATVFASSAAAEEVAKRFAKGRRRQYRLEPVPADVRSDRDPGFIIRCWPIGYNPICAERVFLRVATHRPIKRKPTED